MFKRIVSDDVNLGMLESAISTPLPMPLPSANQANAPANLLATMALKTIGRGKQGARALTEEQSFELFSAIFAGAVGELELGGVLIALRVKGESLPELQGALNALHAVNFAAQLSIKTDSMLPLVLIPSYNGARLQANLVPLLACLLADAGVQVLVHGPVSDAGRLTSAEIFEHLGLAPVSSLEEASAALSRNDPAFIPISIMSPALANMLALRARMGVRNIGHSLAKLLNPTIRSDALRLVSFTHPEFNTLQHDFFIACGQAAMIMRGTEGECVANTRRQQAIDLVHRGVITNVVPGKTGAAASLHSLPEAKDPQATAKWIQQVLAGEREVPDSIAQQVAAILQALK